MFIKLLVFAIESTLPEGKGGCILTGVTEKRQESEIHTIVWVFELLLAGIVAHGLVVKFPNFWPHFSSKSCLIY